MRIKLLIAGLFCILGAWSVTAQDVADQRKENDKQRISIEAVLTYDLPISNNLQRILLNRMRQAINLNGFGSLQSRYLMVPRVVILNKEAVPSVPVKHMVEMEITFLLVDVERKSILQQTTFEVKGIGATEAKAVSNAVQSVNARSKQLKVMLHRGKENIIKYYSLECEQVMRKVKSCIARQLYQEALAELCNIPDVDSACYEEALELMKQIDDEQKALFEKNQEDRATEVDLSWIENN